MLSEAVPHNRWASPLLAAFIVLQSRNASLGLAEYFACLRALSLGYGVGSRAALIVMCQTLWAKSLEQQIQIREILEMTLPVQLSDEDLERIYKDFDAVEQLEPSISKPQPQTQVQPRNDIGRGGEKTPETKSQGDGLDLTWQSGSAEQGIAEPALSNVAYNPRLEFTPQLPISRRHMTRAWRYLRRLKSVGHPTELDVEATIERINRDGVFIEPAFRARLTNQARVTLLIDSGGSMHPFRAIGRLLEQTAKDSGLSNVETYFFHDVPGEYMFVDEMLTEPVSTGLVTGRINRASVLIFSDGGAARGRADVSRSTAMAKFVTMLRGYTPNIVWLNPVPKSRWRRTTASLIVRQSDITMFEFSRTGFDSAVQSLKGVR